eukprot:TRINITY_DN9704_c0_g1_i1.p1 TRINITY_DN9704_c0_g1~~TRINITY_DN9704_c0_g1_i1.p1  ORF type:complete len:215 (-),score=51.29 TRINITY_DN9704_c0_g1_i1:120-725(-)
MANEVVQGDEIKEEIVPISSLFSYSNLNAIVSIVQTVYNAPIDSLLNLFKMVKQSLDNIVEILNDTVGRGMSNSLALSSKAIEETTDFIDLAIQNLSQLTKYVQRKQIEQSPEPNLVRLSDRSYLVQMSKKLSASLYDASYSISDAVERGDSIPKHLIGSTASSLLKALNKMLNIVDLKLNRNSIQLVDFAERFANLKKQQ